MKSPTTQIIAFLGVIVAIVILGDPIASQIAKDRERKEAMELLRTMPRLNLNRPRVSWDDLYERQIDNRFVYFKKFTNTPFTGRVRSLDKNGNVIREGVIKNGLKIGMWTETAGYTSKGTYKVVDGRSRKHGEWREFSDHGTLLIEKAFYKKGNLHGSLEAYHRNGRIWREESYKEGKKDGLFSRWHRSGVRDYEMRFTNGTPSDGPWTRYWPTGGKMYVGNFKNGKQVGIWRTFTKSGVIGQETDFDKDIERHYMYGKLWLTVDRSKQRIDKTTSYTISCVYSPPKNCNQIIDRTIKSNDPWLKSCSKKDPLCDIKRKYYGRVGSYLWSSPRRPFEDKDVFFWIGRFGN